MKMYRTHTAGCFTSRHQAKFKIYARTCHKIRHSKPSVPCTQPNKILKRVLS